MPVSQQSLRCKYTTYLMKSRCLTNGLSDSAGNSELKYVNIPKMSSILFRLLDILAKCLPLQGNGNFTKDTEANQQVSRRHYV